MRTISEAEYNFLSAVFQAARIDLQAMGISRASLVETLDDGGMGSIRFVNCDEEDRLRRKGKSIVEGEFKDSDGMPVSFAVDLDKEERIFEIDIWRVDFEPLKHLPEEVGAICIRAGK